jgi:DtxR family Mn-dependent transcriptional regulator
LLELFLFEHLGFSWDEVHEEAEHLEHVISRKFGNRIDELLDKPTRDPHGDPIPSANGSVPVGKECSLADEQPGFRNILLRVGSKDPEMLRYMDKLGLRPGAMVYLREILPFDGPVIIEVDGEEHSIGRQLAENLFFPVEENTGVLDEK